MSRDTLVRHSLVALVIAVSVVCWLGQLLGPGRALLYSSVVGVVCVVAPWAFRRLVRLTSPQLVLAWGLLAAVVCAGFGWLDHVGWAASFYLFAAADTTMVMLGGIVAACATGVLLAASWWKASREAGVPALATSAVVSAVLVSGVVGGFIATRDIDLSYRGPAPSPMPARISTDVLPRLMPNVWDYEPPLDTAGGLFVVGQAYSRAAESVVFLTGDDVFGSAFIVSPDGLALTAYHVIDSGGPFVAHFAQGRECPVRMLRGSRRADVALLQIDCRRTLPALPLARNTPRPGNPVIVVGTPVNEQLNRTVTLGIISGIREHRGIELVQTDAAINGGNSGGPIIDLQSGRVVGIVSWKIMASDNLGFGISIPSALDALSLTDPAAHTAPGRKH